ncbi:hypothetical protein [uncultured Campylobacter sp.]|nr:hypothetical protein [uncultured Campylobacter sp.]
MAVELCRADCDLAQIPFGEMIQGEGVIYVQICEKCEVLGGCFQCT